MRIWGPWQSTFSPNPIEEQAREQRTPAKSMGEPILKDRSPVDRHPTQIQRECGKTNCHRPSIIGRNYNGVKETRAASDTLKEANLLDSEVGCDALMPYKTRN
jgi:hypothetical protein